MKEFAASEWRRARRSLASAAQLMQDDPDSAASRAYYAVFHAVTAFFALRNQTFTKHSALRAAFHRELVQTGLMPKQCGRDFDFLLELRETGDYGTLTGVSADSAQIAVTKAGALLSEVQHLSPDLRD